MCPDVLGRIRTFSEIFGFSCISSSFLKIFGLVGHVCKFLHMCGHVRMNLDWFLGIRTIAYVAFVFATAFAVVASEAAAAKAAAELASKFSQLF